MSSRHQKHQQRIVRLFIGAKTIYHRLACFKSKKNQELTDHTARILGTGRSDGTFRYQQEHLAEKLIEKHPHLSDEEHDKIRSIFKNTGIKECSSCCPEDLLFQNLGKEKWVEHVKQSHLKMGGHAMEEAISAWGGDRKKISHFIFATATTSQLMPTEGLLLLTSHGLQEDTLLIPMLNVGCCSGFRALAVAKDLVQANPTKHVVLIVCAEARSSLGNAMPAPEEAVDKIQRNALIQAALFRDGASAAIVGSAAMRPPIPKGLTDSSKGGGQFELAILRSEISMVPFTENDGVNTQEHDHNFIKVRTVHSLPQIIGAGVVKGVIDITTSSGVARDKYLLFGHPASYATLSGCVNALSLDHDVAKVSFDCVQTTGNMGGATNLYVVDRWLREHPDMLDKYDYAVCVAPAAGITIQFILLQIVKRGESSKDVAHCDNTDEASS